MINISQGCIVTGYAITSLLNAYRSSAVQFFFFFWPPRSVNTGTVLKLFSKATHKKHTKTIKQTTQRARVRRGNRDKSSESGGQASGGSQLDWFTTAAAGCMYNSDWPSPLSFLQPCKRAQTQHMEARIWGCGVGGGQRGQGRYMRGEIWKQGRGGETGCYRREERRG